MEDCRQRYGVQGRVHGPHVTLCPTSHHLHGLATWLPLYHRYQDLFRVVYFDLLFCQLIIEIIIVVFYRQSPIFLLLTKTSF